MLISLTPIPLSLSLSLSRTHTHTHTHTQNTHRECHTQSPIIQTLDLAAQNKDYEYSIMMIGDRSISTTTTTTTTTTAMDDGRIYNIAACGPHLLPHYCIINIQYMLRTCQQQKTTDTAVRLDFTICIYRSNNCHNVEKYMLVDCGLGEVGKVVMKEVRK